MATRHIRLSLTCVLIFASCRSVAPPPPATPPAAAAVRMPSTGYDVLQAMRVRYAGRWYSNVEILLSNTLYGLDGGKTHSNWREFLAVPGRQRIDYLPLEQQSGVLYTGGRIYSFVNGRPAGDQPGWNALAILAADVYAQPLDSTVRQLDSLGFDLSGLRSDFWSANAVWVVGAAAGDSSSNQFWVDRDSLLVRRVIQSDTRSGRSIVSDVHFRDYSYFSGYPIAKDVSVYRNGRLFLQQRYDDVKVNVALPPGLFDPARFSSPPEVP